MSKQALLNAVTAPMLRSTVPDIAPGMTVRVHQEIVEGEKKRVQIFEGLIIAINNGKGIAGTFTVRKLVDGIGVEKVFPRHGKTVVKVEPVKQGAVRRAKLYYMRALTGKAARMKDTWLNEPTKKKAVEVPATKAAVVAEDVAEASEAVAA